MHLCIRKPRTFFLAVIVISCVTQKSALGQQQHMWYWCESAKKYYPDVSNCKEGWRPVPDDILNAIEKRKENDLRQQQMKAAAEAKSAEEQRKREEQKAAARARADHYHKLLSGEVKVASFDDAVLLYSPVKNLVNVIRSPLLSPSGAVYGASGLRLDAEDEPGTLRLKAWTIEPDEGFGFAPMPSYVFCRITKNTIEVGERDLRINGVVSVVGRYIANQDYQTVSGETKMAPILELLYIGTN